VSALTGGSHEVETMRGSPVDVDEIYIRICLCVKPEPFDADR